MRKFLLIWEVYVLLVVRPGATLAAPAKANFSSEETTPEVAKIDQMPEVVEVGTEAPTPWLANSNQNTGFHKTLNIVKRAPNGFLGMRGKKDQELDDDVDAAEALNWSLDPIQVQNADYMDMPEWVRPKKTPTAFYGVRGKKYPMANGQLMKKLDEEHLKEILFQDFLHHLNDANDLDLQLAAENSAADIDKRAPTGFTGMRGKRLRIGASTDDLSYNPEDYNKRTPTTSFVGVRGKKDVSQHQAFKRSPGEDFLQRGKQQSFFEMANKFVAVRGKKNNFDINNNLLGLAQGHDLANDDMMEPLESAPRYRIAEARYFVNILPSLLNRGNVGFKRTPGGFLGMRGKRPELR